MRQVLGYLLRGSCSAGLISVVSESACKITRFYITEQDLTIKRLNKMHFYRNFLVFCRFSEHFPKDSHTMRHPPAPFDFRQILHRNKCLKNHKLELMDVKLTLFNLDGGGKTHCLLVASSAGYISREPRGDALDVRFICISRGETQPSVAACWPASPSRTPPNPTMPSTDSSPTASSRAYTSPVPPRPSPSSPPSLSSASPPRPSAPPPLIPVFAPDRNEKNQPPHGGRLTFVLMVYSD